MKLTPAQKRYLVRAWEVQEGNEYGICWTMWIPGRGVTGWALLEKRLVEEGCYPMYRLSEQGYRIARELAKKHIGDVNGMVDKRRM